MRTVRVEDNGTWAAADRGLDEDLWRLVRVVADERGLEVPALAGALVLRADGTDQPLAAVLRVALGILLAREHISHARNSAYRLELQALNALLQPAIDARRRLDVTFPSRRQADQLIHYGIDIEPIVRLIGLPLDVAAQEARALGLTVSTAAALLNRAANQVDVFADRHDRISNVIGLHTE